MSAHEGVNVERSKDIGDDIVTSMVGTCVDDYTFQKADQAVTFASSSVLKVKGEPIKVDPQLIFQRLIAVGEHTEDLASLFKYELCSYPSALFESLSHPLQANKVALAHALWKFMKEAHKNPMVMHNMSLMGVHFFIEYLG